MRLNRFLALAGFGSRRGVEEIILAGRVRINGKVVSGLATQVGPQDAVKVDGRLIRGEKQIYAILYKPRGYLCTARDPEERKTVYHLLPREWPRVFYVGRLDKDSEGLLLMTNDGDLSLRLTHPRYKVEKHYEVLLDRNFDPAHTEKLLRGFLIEGGRAKCEEVEMIAPNHLRLVLRQGIKRQIRLMMYRLGYEVERLIRTQVGKITLDNLKPGEWRPLNSREVASLKQPEEASSKNRPSEKIRRQNPKIRKFRPSRPGSKT